MIGLGGNDAAIKRSVAIISLIGSLLFFFAFAFGVIRPRTKLPYRCISWDITQEQSHTIANLGPFELREPIWSRSCRLKLPLTDSPNETIQTEP